MAVTAGRGISNPTRTKDVTKGFEEKSFLSATLSVGKIKEHLPCSPKVVLPPSEVRQEGAVWQSWK